jgi:hypothetical protein
MPRRVSLAPVVRVNKQVKLMMAKVGCHRQVDLVRQFLCFPSVHEEGG